MIENCNDLIFTGISKIINVFNVNSSRLNIFSEYPPNLLGEIKMLELAPHNANYLNIFSVLKNINI